MADYQRTLSSANSGFTLIELMVVVVIIAIIASMAVPSFTRIFAQQRAQQGATDILTAVNQARNQAALSSKPATLTISNNNLQYQVSFSSALTGAATTAGSLQTASYSLSPQLRVSVPNNATSTITVYPNGQLSNSLYYRVCPTNGLSNGYTVWINSFGISRYATGPITGVGNDTLTNQAC